MPAAQQDAPNKIFVGNMPKSWTETKMEEVFQRFGKIEEVSLMKNKETGESRGFGFISFVSPGDASDAIAGMNGKDFDGNAIKVDVALKALHGGGRGGGPGGERGRGRGRGDFRGGMRGRGGSMFRGGQRGGFGPRGGFAGPPMRGSMGLRGRGGSSRGMGRGGEGSMRGGPPSRGMGRGGEGSLHGGMSSRGRGGAGRPLIDRPPVSQDREKAMGRDAAFGRPSRGRSLLGKDVDIEPLLQAPSASELDYPPAREPRGRPVEREAESYHDYASERESAYGSRSAGRYGEEGYGRAARDEYSTSRAAPEYAEARSSRSEYPEDPYRRDAYAASSREVAPARSARDSYAEREYAPSSRSADPYGAAAGSATTRGYASRDPAIAREPAPSRESALGREAPLARDYAPARPSPRVYETLREDPVREYERTTRAYPAERAAPAYARDYEAYDKAASRGYGAETYGRARDPAGSAPSSRAAYSSRDQYASGRGERAEKPAYDPYRSADPYRGRPAHTDRNGASLPSRPYSRY